MEPPRIAARVATAADVPAVVETIARSFFEDPTWSWAFPDPRRRADQYGVWWRFWIKQAVPQDWVRVTGDCAAAAVWIPPSGYECAPEDEPRVEPLISELVGDRARELTELLDRFEAAQPAEPPHYYLSLLGTHPDHRGNGLGVGLLAENLERIDAEGAPAYLESSNSANNHRYERLGFTAIGEFEVPGGGSTVTAMWREAR